MTRLIDADAFKKVLSEHEMKHDKRRSFNDYDCGAANAYEYASDLLDEMPTVEQPHGEWLTEPHSRIIHCSNCGTEENLNKLYVSKFCYSCGADMRNRGDRNENCD